MIEFELKILKLFYLHYFKSKNDKFFVPAWLLFKVLAKSKGLEVETYQ